MVPPVLFPVIPVSVAPLSLGFGLVRPVIAVACQLLLLPFSFAGLLALRTVAISLMAHRMMWIKFLLAAQARPLHSFSTPSRWKSLEDIPEEYTGEH